MPEIKHTFTGGKMNKDLDERLVPSIDYRDAFNVQVRTTDGDAAGTVQNVQGTKLIGSGYSDASWMGGLDAQNYMQWQNFGVRLWPRCIGSVADEKNNKAYFFLASQHALPKIIDINGAPYPQDGEVEYRRVYIDQIIGVDSANTIRPVVTDVFGYFNTFKGFVGDILAVNDWGTYWSQFQITEDQVSVIRPGTEIRFLNEDGGDAINPVTVKALDGDIVMLHEPQSEDPVANGTKWIIASSPRVLRFTPVELTNNSTGVINNYITGINIIDDLLFWTDNFSEPKKVNITRSTRGTDISGEIHSRLFVTNKDKQFVNVASVSNLLDASPKNAFGEQENGGGVSPWLKEEHITVIRKAPKTPPSLDMTKEKRSGVLDISLTGLGLFDILGVNPTIGDDFVINHEALMSTNFQPNDVIILNAPSDDNYTGEVNFTVKVISYVNAENNPSSEVTESLQVQILSSTNINVLHVNWELNLQLRDPLFELKLARFGYRYKYEDGEYSSFSPFSEIAFMPSNFNYDVDNAYNLGMTNSVRDLTVKDFIPYNIPIDVSSVDILYKTTDSPNIYVVDTIARDKDTKWEMFTPDGEQQTTSIKTGELKITSEMVHRVLDQEQVLRSWDNVPRVAKAQEVVGNRLVYGNYIQGFDIDENVNLLQNVRSERNAANKKSIKSLRNYKIGLVFGDKYGRETPVITSGYSTNSPTGEGQNSYTGDVSIPKALCAHNNTFSVRQYWGDSWESGVEPPTVENGGWIDYVKYYVKETSGEYYNLSMDRWYDSGDGGTIWLSFNSADRNKVSEESYLILKNQANSDEPVLSKAKYKVIAIENEAPEYIKTNYSVLGKVGITVLPGLGLNPSDTGVEVTTNGNTVYNGTFWDSLSSNGNDIPEQLTKQPYSINIRATKWNASPMGNTEGSSGIFEREINGKIQFRIRAGSKNWGLGFETAELKSEWRTISHYTSGIIDPEATNVDDPINKFVNISWNKPFKIDDIDFKSKFDILFAEDANYDAGSDNIQLAIEFREAKVENKPEFDGKFFVKIKKDININESLQGKFVREWDIDDTYYIHYIESRRYNQTQMAQVGQTNPYTNTAIEVDANFNYAWFGGEFSAFGGTDDEFENASVRIDSVGNSGASMADKTIEGDCSGADCLPNLYINGVSLYPVYQLGFMENGTEGYYNQSVTNTNDSRFSPFGSLSPNFNQMTYDFWNDTYMNYENNPGDPAVGDQYGGGVKLVTGETAKKGKITFLDACNMATMIIGKGPQADTDIDPGGLFVGDGFGGPNDPVVEGGLYSTGSSKNLSYYWKPLQVFNTGSAIINGAQGAQGGTVGAMCLSFAGGEDSAVSAPDVWSRLREPGTYFQWAQDPVGHIYKTIGVIHSSGQSSSSSSGNYNCPANFRQFNYRGYHENGLVDQFVNIGPDADGNFIPVDTLPTQGYGGAFLRHTQWVEFRKVDIDTGEMLNVGMNLPDFDPRAYMHHDGRDAVGLRIMKMSVSLDGFYEEDMDYKTGATFETEPKESIDVDLYYEATGAIPMHLNKDNVFDFAPINSKVSVSRAGSKVKMDLSKTNHRINNCHPTEKTTDTSILSIVSQGVEEDFGNNSLDSVPSLHKSDISIGDTINITHPSGMVTTALITSFWEPIDDDSSNTGAFTELNSFSDLDDSSNPQVSPYLDTQIGVYSGPKSFKQSTTTFENFQINYSDFNDSLFQSLDSGDVGCIVVSAQVSIGGSWVDIIIPKGITVTGFIDGGTGGYNDTIYLTHGISAFTMEQLLAYVPTGASYGRLALIKPTGYYGISNKVYQNEVYLPWSNCYAFGNGVESDRIRDDFNAPRIDNGVKVSTTFSGYKEEKISSGLIYSGIYNSKSGVNRLNEFNMSQKITKDLNPSYGSIQRLKTRDTDVVTFTEDKVLKILSSKDALYNADGNPQLTATGRVLGTAIPFVGDYGISRNPESLAWDNYRMYFTDKQRGAVLRLSRDGLTPISNAGMKTWFRNNLKVSRSLLGTFDVVNGEYNLTIEHGLDTFPNSKTVSFNESSKGWVSFKDFVASSGLSVSGRYLTTRRGKDNDIWQHNVDIDEAGNTVPRNFFYGQGPYKSRVTLLFNDSPGVVKNFNTMNYEGSQAKIRKVTGGIQQAYTGNISVINDEDPTTLPYLSEFVNVSQNDGQYYNLLEKKGWYVESMVTDQQEGAVLEFKNKEGKWFNKITGTKTVLSNVDTSEFTVQGVGTLAAIEYVGVDYVEPCDPCNDSACEGICGDGISCPDGFVLIGNDCVSSYILGCTDPTADNYNQNATVDDGSCMTYTSGCMDYIDPNYNSIATVSDPTECTGYVVGCTDSDALNYNPLATTSGYTNVMPAYGDQPESSTWIEVLEVACADLPSVNSYLGCCNYGASVINTDDPGWTVVMNCGCQDATYNEYQPYYNCDCSPGDCVSQGGDCECCETKDIINLVGCTDANACNYNPDADLGCVGCCTYDCVCCGDPEAANYGGGWGNTEIADWCTIQSNELFPDGPCLPEGNGPMIVNVGCMDPTATNYNIAAVIECSELGINCNGVVPIDWYSGDFVVSPGGCDCCEYISDVSGDDVPMAEDCVGCIDSGAWNFVGFGSYCIDCSDPSDFANYSPNCCIPFIFGCTDIDSINYNWQANTDDGSCIAIIEGCTEPGAWNYDSSANTDDGSCETLAVGCTDPYSANFNPLANSSCIDCCVPFVFGCMEPYDANYAPDATYYWMGVYQYQINYAEWNDLAPVTSSPNGYTFSLGDNAYSMFDASGNPCMIIATTSDWQNPGLWTQNPDAVGCDFYNWTCEVGTKSWKFNNWEDDGQVGLDQTINGRVFPAYQEPTE